MLCLLNLFVILHDAFSSWETVQEVAQDPVHVAVGALRVQYYECYILIFMNSHFWQQHTWKKKSAEFFISVKV